MHGTLRAREGKKDMALPRTLKGADRRRRLALDDPRELPLWKLVERIRKDDPMFKGRTEIQIFQAAYGDPDNARSTYRTALSTGDDPCVRAFCLVRLMMHANAIMREALKPRRH